MATRADVSTVFDLMAADPPPADEGALVRTLVERGYCRLHAELLVLLVPLACGRVVIATLANKPRVMPDVVEFPDATGCREFIAPLAAIPEYVAALELARSAVETGGPACERVSRVALWGSELRAFQAAYEAGQDLTRSWVGPPTFIGIAGIPGFEEWYRALLATGAPGTATRLGDSVRRPKRWWQFWR
jgi:hypothetical protein